MHPSTVGRKRIAAISLLFMVVLVLCLYQYDPDYALNTAYALLIFGAFLFRFSNMAGTYDKWGRSAEGWAFIPGIGHLCMKRYRRGFPFLVADLVLVALFFVGLAIGPTPDILLIGLVCVISYLFMMVVSVADVQMICNDAGCPDPNLSSFFYSRFKNPVKTYFISSIICSFFVLSFTYLAINSERYGNIVVYLTISAIWTSLTLICGANYLRSNGVNQIRLE